MTDAADRNAARIFDAHGSRLIELIEEAKRIDQNPLIGQKNKRHHLTRVATEFSEFIVPLTACKAGCSHCCYMATAVSQEEADAIAAHTGLTPAKVAFDIVAFHENKGWQDKYRGVPCTFLSPEGRCTIYEVRPMACRLHHSLEDSPDSCKTDSVQEVGVFDVFSIHHAYLNATSMMAEGGSLGDIRQFFPASVVTNKEILKCTPDQTDSWP